VCEFERIKKIASACELLADAAPVGNKSNSPGRKRAEREATKARGNAGSEADLHGISSRTAREVRGQEYYFTILARGGGGRSPFDHPCGTVIAMRVLLGMTMLTSG